MNNESSKTLNISHQPRITYLSKKELIEKLLSVLFTEPLIVSREDPGKYVYVKKDPFLISITVIEARDDLRFISDPFIIERGVGIDRDKKIIYEIVSFRRGGSWEIYAWSSAYDSLIDLTINENKEINYRCIKCGLVYREFERLYRHFISKHKLSISTISGREIIKSVLDLLSAERMFRDKEEDIDGLRALNPKKLFT
jgi:hypothetical protein